MGESMTRRLWDTVRGPALGLAIGIGLGLGAGAVHVGEARQTTPAVAPQDRTAAAVETWAPQFPRPGATKIFENDRVIVWDQIYQDQPFMHRHVRDQLNIVLEDGPIKIVDAAGVERVTPSPNKGKIGLIGYFKAGLGPHSEVAVDPNRRPRIMYIEFKGTEPAELVNGRWPK
jgi:hypothetical protein